MGDQAFGLLTGNTQDWLKVFNNTSDTTNIPTPPMVMQEMLDKEDKFDASMREWFGPQLETSKYLSFVTQICNKALIIDLLKSEIIGDYISLRFLTSEIFEKMTRHSRFRNSWLEPAPYRENADGLQAGTFNFFKFAQIFVSAIDRQKPIVLAPSSKKRVKLYNKLFPKDQYPKVIIFDSDNKD